VVVVVVAAVVVAAAAVEVEDEHPMKWACTYIHSELKMAH